MRISLVGHLEEMLIEAVSRLWRRSVPRGGRETIISGLETAAKRSAADCQTYYCR